MYRQVLPKNPYATMIMLFGSKKLINSFTSPNHFDQGMPTGKLGSNAYHERKQSSSRGFDSRENRRNESSGRGSRPDVHRRNHINLEKRR